MKNFVFDMSDTDLRDEVVGKKIISVNDSSCTLDDGTVLVFEDTSDCCAWFAAEVKAGTLVDSTITGVEVEDRGSPEAWTRESYTIHVLSADTRVMAVEIEGDASSGYYCHSINLNVIRPSKEAA